MHSERGTAVSKVLAKLASEPFSTVTAFHSGFLNFANAPPGSKISSAFVTVPIATVLVVVPVATVPVEVAVLDAGFGVAFSAGGAIIVGGTNFGIGVLASTRACFKTGMASSYLAKLVSASPYSAPSCFFLPGSSTNIFSSAKAT